MKLGSPTIAMLWEQWRVTRAEVAWKLVASIGLALTAMGLCAALAAPGDTQRSLADRGVVAALILLVAPNFLGWLSLAKLNGGRAGFPLPLLYTRPVRTAHMVAVPLVYLAVMSAAIYLVSALLLRVVSGHAFPLWSVAAWIAILNVVLRAIFWSSRTVVAVSLGSALSFVAWMRIARLRLGFEYHDAPALWPSEFNFTPADAALIAVAGLLCFGITLASVVRQRRGDRLAAPSPGTAGSGVWGRLIELFRLPCPTSSAMRAQLWFEMKSKGMPVLGMAAGLAIMVLLLFAAAGPIDTMLYEQFHLTCAQVPGQKCFMARGMAWFLAVICPCIVLLSGAGAFVTRGRKGRSQAGMFEATQVHGTAQLAILQVLVKSACVVAGLIVLVVGAWISLRLFGVETFRQVNNVSLASFEAGISEGIMAMRWHELLALVFVVLAGITGWVATLAALGAMFARYPRGASIAALVVLLSLIGFVALALAIHSGLAPAYLLGDAVLAKAKWVLAGAAALLAAWLLWNGIAERVLGARYLLGAVTVAAAFLAACVALLGKYGLQLAAMPAMGIGALLLLPLLVAMLAPWSLSRLRHV